MIRPVTLLAAAGAAPSRTCAATTPSSRRFGFDDSTQYFTAPDGVRHVHVIGWRGSGGNGGCESGFYAAPGGPGADIDLDAPVNPGDVLVIEGRRPRRQRDGAHRGHERQLQRQRPERRPRRHAQRQRERQTERWRRSRPSARHPRLPYAAWSQ